MITTKIITSLSPRKLYKFAPKEAPVSALGFEPETF
jgi:hypothetical protein